MRYLLLPLHLLKFWYIESLTVFGRILKNSLLFLEEDLAVGLMWKLLFTPLFRDFSMIGRVLSFIFRILRILLGLFAFSLTFALVSGLSLLWLMTPALVILDIDWGLLIISQIILTGGVGLFLIHTFAHPHKKVEQIKKGDNFWAASRWKKKQITTENLLKNPEVKILLAYLETKSDNFAILQVTDLEKVGQDAFALAKEVGSPYLGPVHFWVALLKNQPQINNFLLQFNLKLTDFERAVAFLQKKIDHWHIIWLWDSDFAVHHLKGVNRGWLGVPTPVLDSVSLDLTKEASKESYPQFIGRAETVSQVIQTLSQEGNKNVLLLGEPGSGKSTLLKSLAKQILAGDAPAALATKRMVELDLGRLLAGMESQGELAERIKNIFEEIKQAGNIILAIEEIHDLGLGEASSKFNLYSLLLPYLDSADFQFLATSESANFARIIEKNTVLNRIFIKIDLPVATDEETLNILEDQAIEMERKLKLRVSFLSLKKAFTLAKEFIHDRVLPDSAISLLQQATSQTHDWLTAAVVEQTMQQNTKIPLPSQANKDQLLDLENVIHREFIDQEEAVKKVADSLRRSATGLRESRRPIGSFLFVGPTGVGKTELAKVLSRVYFKNADSFWRFDMSEYQTLEALDKLLGRSGEPGELTEKVKLNPYSLVLLDEFEKANPKILTLFLQVLDDGRLTDGLGMTVDFSQTIIIATSNAGSLTIAQGLEKGQTLESLRKPVHEQLLQIFKPELLNRFDEVVLFKSLSRENLQKIIHLQLTALENKLKEQGYLIEFDQSLLTALDQAGFDPVLGARPLRRLIQDSLETNLSKMILENKLAKGQTLQINSAFLTA